MTKRLASLTLVSFSLVFFFSLAQASAASAEGAVTAAPEVAARLLQLVNEERASAGLPAMVARDDVAAIAGPHSADMAAAHDIWHNEAYFTASTRSSLNAKALGENVGKSTTAEASHQAFMNSPAHRANVLDGRFTVAGFGAARDERGILYVTENFVMPNTAKAAPAPAAAPVAPAAPAPATTVKAAPAPKPAPVPVPIVRVAARTAPAPTITVPAAPVVPPAPVEVPAPAEATLQAEAAAAAPDATGARQFSIPSLRPVATLLAGTFLAVLLGAMATVAVRRVGPATPAIT